MWIRDSSGIAINVDDVRLMATAAVQEAVGVAAATSQGVTVMAGQ